MRQLSLLVIAVTLLAGCQRGPEVAAAVTPASALQAHWGGVTFSAKVSYWYRLRENPYAGLEVTGKPKFGESAVTDIFDADAAGARMEGDGRRHILFGRDNVLYVSAHEHVEQNTGPYKEQRWEFGDEFYRVGTYTPVTSFETGTAIAYKLDEGVTLERQKTAGVPAWLMLHIAKLPAVTKSPVLVKAPGI